MALLEIQRRQPICLPGRLVYSAQIDQDKLECLYCLCQCTLCNKASAAKRSLLDVYTNGVMTNTPTVCLCCLQVDRTNFMYFDDPRIGSSGKAGCCTPFPYPCPHCCNCCGEVIYFFRCCGCCMPACYPLGLGHSCMCWYCCCCSCCITDLFCGLAPGEAEKVNMAIANTRAGNFILIDYPPINAMPMGMGQPIAMAQPVAAAGQPIQYQQPSPPVKQV